MSALDTMGLDMQHFLFKFLVRWFVSTLGLWVAASLLGSSRLSIGVGLGTVVGAGFFLAVVNMTLKPILVIFSFPAIIFSLGLFMLVLNGFLIQVVSWLYSPLYVKNLGVAIIAGLIVGLVNFLVTRIMKEI